MKKKKKGKTSDLISHGGVDMEGRKNAQQNPQSVVANEKKRILYIDDEKDFLWLTKMRLEKSGEFEVITTTDPEEGIELAKKLQPGLILLDAIMPGLDGGRVAEILLDNVQTKRIPIIFYTSLINDLRTENGRLQKIGGRDFIPKNTGRQELLSCVRKVLC